MPLMRGLLLRGIMGESRGMGMPSSPVAATATAVGENPQSAQVVPCSHILFSLAHRPQLLCIFWRSRCRQLPVSCTTQDVRSVHAGFEGCCDLPQADFLPLSMAGSSLGLRHQRVLFLLPLFLSHLAQLIPPPVDHGIAEVSIDVPLQKDLSLSFQGNLLLHEISRLFLKEFELSCLVVVIVLKGSVLAEVRIGQIVG